MGILSNFKKLHDNWAGFDLIEETIHVAENNEKVIADFNRVQLYEKGETVDGKKLKKYRNAKYARVKNSMNPLPGLGNPDFYVTGEFQKSIFADVRGKSIILDAADPKVEFLVERDGEGIFGLQDESKVQVWNRVLRPPLIQRLNKKTGSNIQI